MRIVLVCEIIALFVSPFVLAIWNRRHLLSASIIAFVFATLLGLFSGSYFLYLKNAETLFSLTSKDWLLAIFLALFSWVLVYLLSRWFLNELLRK